MNALKSYYSTNYIKKQAAFTIVELLIVVVVIAILAAITIVSYNSITTRAIEATLKSDLRTAANQLGVLQVGDGLYPTPNLPDEVGSSDNTTLEYISNGQTFCLSALSSNTNISSYHITNDGAIMEGACPIEDGTLIQAITSANCPTTRVRAVDARDNHTYWVQKLADGNCWMLTNLAYGGGGINAYDDVKVLQNGTGDAIGTYTEPKYYVSSTSSNPTTEPANPVTTSGSQAGYYYNWCAAMGAQNGTNGQPSTAACANVATPAPDITRSVCPAGWRLPTGGVTGDFYVLNTAVNGGQTEDFEGLLSFWLAQFSGYWGNGTVNNFGGGGYWSSSSSSSVWSDAFYRHWSSGKYILIPNGTFRGKSEGYSVRCVAV